MQNLSQRTNKKVIMPIFDCVHFCSSVVWWQSLSLRVEIILPIVALCSWFPANCLTNWLETQLGPWLDQSWFGCSPDWPGRDLSPLLKPVSSVHNSWYLSPNTRIHKYSQRQIHKYTNRTKAGLTATLIWQGKKYWPKNVDNKFLLRKGTLAQFFFDLTFVTLTFGCKLSKRS